MMFEFRTTDFDQIEWRPVSNTESFCLVGIFKRTSMDIPITIAHIVDIHGMETWWALDILVTQMLGRDTDKTEFGRSDGASRFVVYRQPVIVQQSWSSDKCHLIDIEGCPLSGSNLHDARGKLCLGVSANPMSVQPIESLIGNTANRDLGWRGDRLKGKWMSNPSKTPYFEIQSWPTMSPPVFTVPQIVKDVARQLWRSSSHKASPE